MKLAVSNLAWAPAQRMAVYDLMREAGITGLEIAPGLFLTDAVDPFRPGEDEAAMPLVELEACGLQLCSMQSLLYGREGPALFGSAEGRAAFEAAMGDVIALAGRFRIGNLVLGSWRNRLVPPDMSGAVAYQLARDSLGRLAEAAEEAGTVIGLEPVATAYGANFLTGAAEVAEFVASVDHAGLRMTLDTGEMETNGTLEQFEDVVSRNLALISHVHVSAPELGPAAVDLARTTDQLRALRSAGYAGWVSLEMLPPPIEPLAVLDSALQRLARAAADA